MIEIQFHWGTYKCQLYICIWIFVTNYFNRIRRRYWYWHWNQWPESRYTIQGPVKVIYSFLVRLDRSISLTFMSLMPRQTVPLTVNGWPVRCQCSSEVEVIEWTVIAFQLSILTILNVYSLSWINIDRWTFKYIVLYRIMTISSV